jgi:hypothetical protein
MSQSDRKNVMDKYKNKLDSIVIYSLNAQLRLMVREMHAENRGSKETIKISVRPCDFGSGSEEWE